MSSTACLDVLCMQPSSSTSRSKCTSIIECGWRINDALNIFQDGFLHLCPAWCRHTPFYILEVSSWCQVFLANSMGGVSAPFKILIIFSPIEGVLGSSQVEATNALRATSSFFFPALDMQGLLLSVSQAWNALSLVLEDCKWFKALGGEYDAFGRWWVSQLLKVRAWLESVTSLLYKMFIVSLVKSRNMSRPAKSKGPVVGYCDTSRLPVFNQMRCDKLESYARLLAILKVYS